MERFEAIYPFTTENIAGYMKCLDLSLKKIVTVTGSGDHILNAIARGAMDIRAFDVNPKAPLYSELKIASIQELSYEDFLHTFLYHTKNFDCDFVSQLAISEKSKDFWIQQLLQHDQSWCNLHRSSLFNRKHFNPDSKLWENIYLERESYEVVRNRIQDVKITYITQNLKDLVLEEECDYMFLSNISDHIHYMYQEQCLENYKKLITNYLKMAKIIYFAYLYDFGNDHPRSDMDDLKKVNKLFHQYEWKLFKSALEGESNKEDGVLFIRRN